MTDQQIFNALRYGLRPEDTPDVKITSRTPGQGNFPKEPNYLGPFMPWASWRYMSGGGSVEPPPEAGQGLWVRARPPA